ncbi:uncharacterized protein [Hetaerina americana]|uniref:uncharacterized protein n=1 Tax=Hetaerina americana TaxID=62018 RepID=UPI003A7F277B
MALQAKLYLKLFIKCRIASLNIYFNSQCLKRGVTPKFVSIKSCSSSPAAQHAISTAKKVWVQKEVKMWYSKREAICHYLFILHMELCSKLHPAEFQVWEDRVRSRTKSICDAKRKVLNQKLYILSRVLRNSDTQSNPKLRSCDHKFAPRVVNLSNSDLSPSNLVLLNKGLKYAPVIPTTTNGYKNLAADCDTALSREPIGTKQLIANIISEDIKKPPFYSSRPVREDLTLKMLKKVIKEGELAVVKADKGNSTVIMDRENYISKCQNFIASTNSENLLKDPTPSYQRLVKGGVEVEALWVKKDRQRSKEQSLVGCNETVFSSYLGSLAASIIPSPYVWGRRMVSYGISSSSRPELMPQDTILLSRMPLEDAAMEPR